MDFLIPDDWIVLAKLVGVAVAMYVAVVASIRVSGKRTTSQLNNFDWVVTVAMGSIVASTILQNGVPLVNGLVALVALTALQWSATKLAFHFKPISKALRSTPRILLWEGEFLHDQMAIERVTRNEILSSVRGAGIDSVDDVAAVVMESDASLSVLKKGDEAVRRGDSAFQTVSPTVDVLRRSVGDDSAVGQERKAG